MRLGVSRGDIHHCFRAVIVFLVTRHGPLRYTVESLLLVPQASVILSRTLEGESKGYEERKVVFPSSSALLCPAESVGKDASSSFLFLFAHR